MPDHRHIAYRFEEEFKVSSSIQNSKASCQNPNWIQKTKNNEEAKMVVKSPVVRVHYASGG
jgi:hypothetical protein